MELNEKLLSLRKKNKLTQAQVSETVRNTGCLPPGHLQLGNGGRAPVHRQFTCSEPTVSGPA